MHPTPRHHGRAEENTHNNPLHVRIHITTTWRSRRGAGRGWGGSHRFPTVLRVLVLGVGQGEVGVGPAGEAGAAARLGVAAAPEPHGVLRGHDAVRLRVGVRAHADRVVAVRHSHLAPVGGHVGREGLAEAEAPQGEFCTCREDAFSKHCLKSALVCLCMCVT